MSRKDIHYNCFNGDSNYIPLIVKVPSGQSAGITNWEAMNDPQKAIDRYIIEGINSIKVKSDFQSMIESNFMECLIPSLFGAIPYEAPGGAIDVKPVFKNVYELENISVPDLMGGMMPQAIEHLKYICNNCPEGTRVEISRSMSPVDTAVVLAGGDFYLYLAMEPEICHRFLDVITETTIGVVKILKDVANHEFNDSVTVRGLYFKGLRLTSDAIVNLSPAMIEEFYFPMLKKFKETFGNVMLHYCCLPAPSGHVLPALTNCDYVTAVDNWQGYRTFVKNDEDLLQDKIAICTDLSYDKVVDFERIYEEEPFFHAVKRKGGRGITITTTAPSIEEGQKIYDNWQKLKFWV